MELPLSEYDDYVEEDPNACSFFSCVPAAPHPTSVTGLLLGGVGLLGEGVAVGGHQ